MDDSEYYEEIEINVDGWPLTVEETPRRPPPVPRPRFPMAERLLKLWSLDEAFAARRAG
jgi:hypothetical protein